MESFNDIFKDCTSLGRKIPKDEYITEGKYIIVDQGQNEIAGYTDLEDGVFKDVPAIIFGDHTRIIKYVDKPFFLGADGVKLLKSKKQDANYKYLYYALKNVKIPDTGYNRHFKWLKEVDIEYTSPDKQKEVVKILDAIAKVIEDRKLEIQQLDKLIKARFVELYNNSSLGEKTTLEAITERVKVGFVGTCEKYYTDASGIPMLRTGNITDKGIDLADLKYVTPEFHEKNKKSQIHEGDLLIARHGSNGQANVYYGQEAQCLNAVVIVPNYEMTTSIFLAGLINSPMVKEQIERTLVGSTQHVVNTKSIAGLVVRIPDLTVQKEYEAFVKQVDKSKVAGQKALDKAQLLFDSLMQEYFG